MRLGDRQSVSRNDDHPLRVREHDGDVLRARRAHSPVCVSRRTDRPRDDLSECTEEDVGNRTVHRASHQDRQQGARRSHEHSAHDQDVVVQDETCRGRGKPGECIQQRDHDWHVRTTDRQHEENAEQQGAADQCDHERLALRPRQDDDREGHERGHQREIHDLLSRIHDRTAADELLQLAERDQTAGKRHAADQCGQHDRDADVRVNATWRRRDVVEVRECDQRSGAASDAVEERHHLRHRRHLHGPRRVSTDRCKDGHHDQDREIVVKVGLSERRREGDQHSERANAVAEWRGRGGGEKPQRQDERDDGDEIRERDRVSSTHPSPAAA